MTKVMKNFRAEDMRAAAGPEPEVEPEPTQAAPEGDAKAPAAAPEQVEEEQKASPAGTVKEILDWVDEPKTDKGKRNRAQKALDQERDDPEPRVTLVAKLEEIASAE